MRNKIAIVGEAWGEAEEKARTAFVGAAGYALTSMLDEAGISRSECFLTNVFALRPAGNKIKALCGAKSEAIQGYPSIGKDGYVRAEFATELNRLADEILHVDPNIIIALGNTPSWAFLGRGAISKYRGVTDVTTLTAIGYKILCTYHPSYIIRGAWSDRPTVILDLIKAKRESEYPEIRRPVREIWIEPTLEDINEFFQTRVRDFLSVDIETSGNQITCIGFAPGPEIGLVIPFLDSRRRDRCYWSDANTEQRVWKVIKGILGRPEIRKLFQNGLYDIAFLWRAYGIRVMGTEHDTMLLHHALQPESLKGLGFLGSIYTDEGAWKQMRTRSTTIKADE